MKIFKTSYILIIFFILIIGILVFYYSSNINYSNNNINQSTDKISTEINIENPNNQDETSNNYDEYEISTYSTQIKDTTPGRLNNIRITCNILNNQIIKPNAIFSFNEIVGNPTVEKGYQEAKIIINHKTETGIGGGNCQVSSTLYNAVLAIPSLVVIERHEHGKEVGYVPKGKDAAVSYGSLDFKFRNDNSYSIKINLSTDDKFINTSIIKINN